MLAMTGVAAGCSPISQGSGRACAAVAPSAAVAASPVHRPTPVMGLCIAGSAQWRADCEIVLGNTASAVLFICALAAVAAGCARLSVNHNPPMLAIGCLRGKTTRAQVPARAVDEHHGREERSIAILPNLSLINAAKSGACCDHLTRRPMGSSRELTNATACRDMRGAGEGGSS